MSADRLTALLIGGGLALLLLVIATGGPDCLWYLDWAHAAKDADIGRIDSGIFSPMGVPLTQWSHGPGMFFALPYVTPGLGAIVHDGPLAPAKDFRLMGWLAALALWGGLIGLLRRLTGGDMTLTLFIAAVAFAGTHLGFYSFNHSSEVLTFGSFALAAYLLYAGQRLGPLHLLGVGAAIGALVLTRPHLGIYLPLLFGYIFWRLLQQREDGVVRRALGIALAATPPLIALLQIILVNRWMTGSVIGSTYSFGDGSFRSLDFARPELLATAFHPWHGLFVYHPLYALAFIILLVGAFRASRGERWLYLGIAVTLLLHFYIQAAWHCWWLGLWSLGNRGLGIAALLLLPPLARIMQLAAPAGRLALASGMLLCALWSLLLMIQGHTNFYRWAELFAAQADTVAAIALFLPAALLAALVAWFLARGRGMIERRLATGGALLMALILDHLARLLLASIGTETEGWGAAALRLGFMALAPALVLLRLPRLPARPRIRPLVGMAVLLLFLAASALFLRVVYSAEKVIGEGGLPGGGPVATYELPEVEECYREYLMVPGFEDKKAAMRAFLDNQRSGSELRY